MIGNVAYDNGGSGFYLTGDFNCCRIIGNEARDNGARGFYGPSFVGDGVVFEGNIAEGNTQQGIHFSSSTATDMMIASNISYDNTGDDWGSLPTGATVRHNVGYVASGDVVTIFKAIDHASLTDNGDATAYMDFDDSIPAGSVVQAVKCDFTEAFNSDDTTTLTMMIGYVGDLDAFNLTADPGENAFNHTTDVYWYTADCQAPKVAAAKTPRVTFTEDDDGTDIISSANAQGGVTISITYMKA